MNNTIIYLIGFPGSSKFTTAKQLCKIIDAVIASNNLFNRIIFDIVSFTNTEVPDNLWGQIFAVRKNMLEILEKYYIKSKHYIFTDELIEGDSHDQDMYDLMVNLSKKTKMTIFFVVLHCNNGELIKRVQSQDRYQDRKITDPDFAMKRIAGKKLFIPENAFEIDNSNLSVEDVANKIIEEMKNRKLTLSFISNHD